MIVFFYYYFIAFSTSYIAGRIERIYSISVNGLDVNDMCICLYKLFPNLSVFGDFSWVIILMLAFFFAISLFA